MIKFFLSSVRRGLQELRTQIVEGLRTAGFNVSNMEIFGARPELPLESCLAEVRRCDAMILVVGPRYGALTPAGDVSFTHEEFREACRRGIPVFAFLVPPAEDASEDEQNRLHEFAAEASQARLRKSTEPGNLVGEIAFTLLQEKRAGRLGRRFAFFQTHDQFFAQQLEEKRLFNHSLPLVGRASTLDQLTGFLCSTAPAQIISAPGGAGKSRLLLELSRRAEQDPAVPQLRFAIPEARWTGEDIAELPTTPVVVVVDDGHRRPNLDALIQACRRHNSEARFLVSCRPALVNGVRYHLRTIETIGDPTEPIQLAPLEAADALELAREALTEESAELAERLVIASEGNPLVIVVGGRCIATHRVAPEVLGTPEEFQRIVLDRMLDDPVFAGAEGRLRRDVLDVIATIGPVSMEDRTVPESIAEFVGSQSHEVRTAMGELARAGFLMRRGRLGRVTPDVLADHLLFCKAVSPDGQPTGFVDSIFETFASGYLGNTVSNAAELDWRIAALGGEVEVLSLIWQRIDRQLPSLSHPARSELVSNLRRAAVFTPRRVLEVLEWLLEHPDAPAEPLLAGLGLTTLTVTLQDGICELLKIIATHPDYTRRGVDALIPIVPGDNRRTNQYPAHPRRVLEDLAGYEIGRHLACQQTVVERIRDVVRNALPDSPVAWAAPVLGAALVRSGESHRGTRHGLTIRGFPLSESLDRIAPIREVAIEGLVSLCDRESAGDAAAAVAELAKLLDAPRGIFGREVLDEEIRTWVPEATRAANELTTIATTAPLDVTRYLARRALRDVRDDFWSEIAGEVRPILDRTPAIADETLFDLFVGLPYDLHADDFQAERECAARCAKEVTHGLVARYHDLHGLLNALAERVTYIQHVYDDVDAQNYAEFARALAAEHSDHKIEWATAIIQHPAESIHRLLPAALLTIKEEPQQEVFSRLIDAVCQSPYETLRAVTANSFFYLVNSESADRSDLDLLKRFLNDPSTAVRRAAIWPLGQFQARLPDEVAEAAVSVEIGDDADLAEELCGLFCRHRRRGPTGLTDEQVDHLLAKLQPLRRLESRTHNVLTFIAYVSKRRPRSVVEMLLSRIQNACLRDVRGREERYDAIPIGGHGLSLPGLRESSEYLALLRQIRDAAETPDPLARHHLATLFCVAADLQAAADVLGEWTSSDDREKVVAAASLLREYHEDVVFALGDFVADTLDNAAKLGRDCYKAVSGQFFGIAISGAWTGAVGEPSPRHLRDKKLATEMAQKYASRPNVRQFYEAVAGHAEDSIRRELTEFEEEEFE